MIPKIIHYTWFSGDEYPDKIQACIDSWKQFLPDYELRKWDMNSITNIDSIFLKEALSKKKWAYAADFVRLYAVYNFGGIYLDTDARLYKSLDQFLNDGAFIGKENSFHFSGGRTDQYLSSHCFGAERCHPFIKLCLDYYDSRHFITSNNEHLPNSLKLNLVLLPYIQTEIARMFGYDSGPINQQIQRCDEGLTIYPSSYFDMTKDGPNAYCQHLALGGWRDEKAKEPTYSFSYKIQWRIWAVIEKILRAFNRSLIKLN